VVVRPASEGAEETVLCEGETIHFVVGRDMKRREMPAKYVERFAAVMHRMGKKA
jgi:acyl-CoA thioester hydrolase